MYDNKYLIVTIVNVFFRCKTAVRSVPIDRLLGKGNGKQKINKIGDFLYTRLKSPIWTGVLV
jgi:hypothetical protein